MASHPVLFKIKNAKAVVMDVDGVLTDGKLLIYENGSELRTMNIRDGYAIQLAARKGIELCVITGGHSEGVKIRLHRLGVQTIYAGIQNKADTLSYWIRQKNLKPEEVIYIGDDMPDLQAMKLSGVKCCPSDACSEIISVCDYISPKAGGHGVVRDVLEKMLRLKNCWE